MSFLLKLLEYSPIGKTVLKMMKKRVSKYFKPSPEEIINKQDSMLKKKLIRMKDTGIGKRLGIHDKVTLEELPLTNYDFYKPFYETSLKNDLMDSPRNYIKIETSGTSGSRKKFLFNKQAIMTFWKETGMMVLLLMFHDGEKITLEYGDTIYVNVPPGPFMGETFTSTADKQSYGIVKFLPNINLSYKDKVNFL